MRNVTSRSEALRRLVDERRVGLAGAVYELRSGRVAWVGPQRRPSRAASSRLLSSP